MSFPMRRSVWTIPSNAKANRSASRTWTSTEISGIISSGAGLGMASMDINRSKASSPPNFLETGGGITEDLLYKCMDLVMAKQGLKGIFINVYGGINPIHEGAKGVVRYIKEHEVDIPVVAKALGNRQEETWETLESGGVPRGDRRGHGKGRWNGFSNWSATGPDRPMEIGELL